MLNPEGLYFAYLRKSREDREAELQGAGETLARHEKMLKENPAIRDVYEHIQKANEQRKEG